LYFLEQSSVRVLRRILEHKKDDVRGEWKTTKEELHNLYSSRIINRMMKSRWMKRTEHAA
jgi:hypothetical protein